MNPRDLPLLHFCWKTPFNILYFMQTAQQKWKNILRAEQVA